VFVTPEEVGFPDDTHIRWVDREVTEAPMRLDWALRRPCSRPWSAHDYAEACLPVPH
jgi:hypothetical protein